MKGNVQYDQMIAILTSLKFLTKREFFESQLSLKNVDKFCIICIRSTFYIKCHIHTMGIRDLIHHKITQAHNELIIKLFHGIYIHNKKIQNHI